MAAVGHGVPSVDGQVHDHLLDVAGISMDGRRIGRAMEGDLDVLTDQARQQAANLLEQFSQANGTTFHDLFAAEGEQLPGEISSSLTGTEGLFERLFSDRFELLGSEDQTDMALDDGENVVEIVRH